MRRVWRWIDDRTGLITRIGRIAHHPVPPRTGWRYVLGSATLIAFLIQVGTGIALATVYVPSTTNAYNSIDFITHGAALGHVLRGMHYFGASAMMILIGLHLLRVFLTASYKFPREVNWLTGVGLLGLVVVMAFTGQLLRWDQNAVWSAVVAAEQAGRVPWIGTALAHFILAGDRLGGATLSRFFAFHVFFVPAIIFLFIGIHVYLVLHNGISEPPDVRPRIEPATYRKEYRALLASRGRSFWPDVVWRDAIMALVVVVVVLALAQWIGPPEVGKPPNPSIINASPRPDWYFLWYFAVLAVLPKHVEQPYFIVLAPLIAFTVLIALPFVFPSGERRLTRRPWAALVAAGVLFVVGYFWWLGERAPWSPVFDVQPLVLHGVAPTDTLQLTGARLFHDKGCEFCHTVAGQGGHHGPDLSRVGARLDSAQIVSRILGGGADMPAFVGKVSPAEVQALVGFLRRDHSHRIGSSP
ncbi:MAG TPA: cytochrome b N-terminal domain-containing protein [Gemmatimonadaceae bacterium]|nr:cytochrome b N-terminal domain-containing protein [Gemmatimonadaceae bacterium]